MVVRKGLLLLVSAIWVVLIWWGLYGNVAAQSHQEPTAVSEEIKIGNTGLTALSLAVYEGLYLEDSGREEVVDIAALVLRNDTDAFVKTAVVTIKTQSQTLHFAAYALPPGAEVLILEQEKQAFIAGSIVSCDGEAVFENSWLSEAVIVEESGDIQLQIKNMTKDILAKVILRYKSYDQDSGMYIGGAVYTFELHDLLPDETRTVIPPYYVSGYSRVVSVET